MTKEKANHFVAQYLQKKHPGAELLSLMPTGEMNEPCEDAAAEKTKHGQRRKAVLKRRYGSPRLGGPSQGEN